MTFKGIYIVISEQFKWKKILIRKTKDNSTTDRKHMWKTIEKMPTFQSYRALAPLFDGY